MAKRRRTKKATERQGTNWLVIGGVAAVGVIGLFALLFLALREPEDATLADYCGENPDRCVVLGDPSADVQVVEVSDFGCSHCRDFHAATFPTLKEQYIDAGNVYWMVLPYALSNATLPASNAAMCAQEQGAYLDYGEALFAQQGEPEALTRDGFLQAAAELDLNADEFQTCLEQGRYNGVIQDNVNAARTESVSATPTFFINGQRLEGALPLSVFQQRIAAAGS